MTTATIATIINAWQDGTYAYLAVSVAGDTVNDGVSEPVQYIGQTPILSADGSSKPLSQIRTELISACKAKRDAQKATPSALAVSGQVNI